MNCFVRLTLLLFCSLLLSCAGVRGSNKAVLLDTNQTKCYNNSTSIPCPSPGKTFYGQDAQYSINTPSYTDNGDGTVTDNVTGLMWQQDAGNSTYNWYEATGNANIKLNFDRATDICGSLSLAGNSDWRLPTSMELMSIVHYGKSRPAVDTKYFHNVKGKWWWTSSTVAGNSNKAYDIIFYRHGYIDVWEKSAESYARCVRDGNYSSNQDTMAERFTDNGDTTVMDNYIRLMWQQGESSSMSWEPALRHCNELHLAGYNDWRLPNVKTLQSLVDGKYRPTIDTTYFPNAYSSLSYWTSTSDTQRPKRGWNVNFDTGKDKYSEKSKAYYVRCVRGGK